MLEGALLGAQAARAKMGSESVGITVLEWGVTERHPKKVPRPAGPSPQIPVKHTRDHVCSGWVQEALRDPERCILTVLHVACLSLTSTRGCVLIRETCMLRFCFLEKAIKWRGL